MKASDTAVLAFAPGTPPHTLVVVFPAQMAFLGSLVKRKLVTKAHAFRLAFVFLFGLFMLCLARGIGASEPETIIGAKRKDSTHEELDVVGTTVDVLIALARAAGKATGRATGAAAAAAAASAWRRSLWMRATTSSDPCAVR